MPPMSNTASTIGALGLAACAKPVFGPPELSLPLAPSAARKGPVMARIPS